MIRIRFRTFTPSQCRNQGAVHATACKGAGSRVRCTAQPAKVQEPGCGARVKGAGSRVGVHVAGCRVPGDQGFSLISLSGLPIVKFLDNHIRDTQDVNLIF